MRKYGKQIAAVCAVLVCLTFARGAYASGSMGGVSEGGIGGDGVYAEGNTVTGDGRADGGLTAAPWWSTARTEPAIQAEAAIPAIPAAIPQAAATA